MSVLDSFTPLFVIFLSIKTLNAKVVPRDLPGENQILIINMRAQHITFNKAIIDSKI